MADVISSTDTAANVGLVSSPVFASVCNPWYGSEPAAFSSLLPHTDFTIKSLLSITSTKCIVPHSANKPITSFNCYQVFEEFYWLSHNCKRNHFSDHNTTFINPGFRSHYFSVQNKHMLLKHIGEKWSGNHIANISAGGTVCTAVTRAR